LVAVPPEQRDEIRMTILKNMLMSLVI